MAKARTIDNLGVDVSNRYATDQMLIDQDFLVGTKQIGDTPEVSVTSPYVVSDFEEQFNTLRKNTSWARFSPPPNFLGHRKKIFSFQLIPSLGALEKQEAELERLTKEKEEKKKKQQKLEVPSTLEEEKERNKIINLLKTLGILDKYLSVINAKRGQYHKG